MEVTDMFIALIMVTVRQAYTYLQTHSIVYIKYIQLLLYKKMFTHTHKSKEISTKLNP